MWGQGSSPVNISLFAVKPLLALVVSASIWSAIARIWSSREAAKLLRNGIATISQVIAMIRARALSSLKGFSRTQTQTQMHGEIAS